MNKDADFYGDMLSIRMLLHGTLQPGQTRIFTLVPFSTPVSMVDNQLIATAAPLSKPCAYRGNNTKTGQVPLTKFDPVARVAAGRFDFTLYEPGGCDTLRVTNGRFDVKF